MLPRLASPCLFNTYIYSVSLPQNKKDKLIVEIIKDIVLLLTALGGFEGVKYFLNRKSNGRKATADATLAEFKVLQETVVFLQEQLKKKEERFAEHIEVHRQTVQQLLDAERRIGELLAERSLKLCEIKKCKGREPFSGY